MKCFTAFLWMAFSYCGMLALFGAFVVFIWADSWWWLPFLLASWWYAHLFTLWRDVWLDIEPVLTYRIHFTFVEAP